MNKTLSRKCIATSKIVPTTDLIRIVKTPTGSFEINSKSQGRGAYVTNTSEAIEKVIKHKLLHKTFKMKIEDSVYKELENMKG